MLCFINFCWIRLCSRIICSIIFCNRNTFTGNKVQGKMPTNLNRYGMVAFGSSDNEWWYQYTAGVATVGTMRALLSCAASFVKRSSGTSTTPRCSSPLYNVRTISRLLPRIAKLWLEPGEAAPLALVDGGALDPDGASEARRDAEQT